MSDDTARVAAIRRAVEDEDWERVEELWLEALDHDPIPYPALVDLSVEIADGGHPGLARTLLELLADAVEAADDHRATLTALVELVRQVGSKPPAELLERLERALGGARAGSASRDAVLARHRLVGARRPLEVLDAAQRWLDHDVGTVVEVIGQGYGRVVDLNLELENVRVDLGGGKPISVPFGAVSRYLRLLPEGSFLWRKVREPELLAELVAAEPGEALAQLLESLGEPADVPAIKAALDGLLPGDQWTSWWGRARKHPRIVTSGAGTRVRYSVTASARGALEVLLDELESAAPRERLTVAKRLAARGDEAAGAAAERLAGSLAELEETDIGLAWETALVVRDLPGGRGPAQSCLERIVGSARPLELLERIADRGARMEALQAERRARPERWPELAGEWMLHEDHPANLDQLAAELTAAGLDDLLDAALEAVFRNHIAHACQFIWACEAMTEPGAPEAVRRRMTASVLELLPDALSRKEFSPLRNRAKALLDGGRAAIQILLEVATPQQATRFGQRVSRMGSVEPQRARLVERAVQQRQGSETTAQAAPLVVATAAAIEAKRAQLKELLEVEIPRTLKGINAAAAEGDLRENFEYHMLRDRQELLSARAAKLQRELGEVRVIQPGAADASRVNVGTVVRFEALGDEPVEPVTILGAWDADVSKRVFASGTELAQALLDRVVGDQVQVEGRPARIAAIEPWTGD